MSQSGNVLASVQESLAKGRADQARATLQRALEREPSNPDLNSTMAVVLARLGQADRAAYFAQRAARAHPGPPEFLEDVGKELASGAGIDVAAHAFEQALTREPAHAGLRLGLGAILRGAGRFVDGARQLEIALAGKPDDVPLALRTIRSLIDAGLGPEAAALAGRMAERHPWDDEFARLLAFYSNYLPDPNPAAQAKAHARFGELVHRMLPEEKIDYPNTKDPDRTLRVGVLSPDLRHAAVAFFIEPFFENRDRRGIELLAYSTALKHDRTGERLKGLADRWVHAPDWSDFELAATIRRDGVDVLLDLAGLTSRNRLGVLALRAAPVQATYLGYPNTTGLRTVDYRIVDPTTDPAGTESSCTEALVRMDPCFLCYKAPDYAPPTTARPPDAPFTFGSFNSLLKFNRVTAGLWSRLLDAVPGSRLLMKSEQFKDAGSRQEAMKILVGAGADQSRVELTPPTQAPADHLGSYARVDIALDTFPYGGTTTTCEALWMGVPVVTMAGPVHAGRVGASILGAVGLGDLVAAGPEEFVRIGAALSADRARRTDLRGTLRDRVRSSVLCDGPTFAHRLENTLRGMWRDYCSGTKGRRG